LPGDDPLEKHRSTAQELKDRLALQAASDAILVARDHTGAQRLWALDPAGPAAVIGRTDDAAVAIGWDPAVSAAHAEIRRVVGWVLVDDGLSTNGTYVAGERVVGSRRLSHEDRITVGETIIGFLTRADAAVPTGTLVLGAQLQRSDLSPNEFAVLRALCRPMLMDGAEEPATNPAIVKDPGVFVGFEAVKRCMTNLFVLFDIVEAPKRSRLAKRAIAGGIVRRADCT
jgi:pSer/pThr/pTyr-binding forkhead associated (FHA) protein